MNEAAMKGNILVTKNECKDIILGEHFLSVKRPKSFVATNTMLAK
jgi:S-adenosylhomocysteine hydrolase